ncbi:carcinoembryonic antigen-related cell adhesion molecule 5-like, partial [Brachyistius frenatus]|uniref:carcinoembryonic antigen-related cell adhesion molecule 5-like n=1 Tax=Brachyistius frenatus TaxID=100188 RepID=UPI0037E769F3
AVVSKKHIVRYKIPTACVANVVLTSNTTDVVEFNSSVSLSCSSSGSSLSFLWLNSSSEVTESDRVQLTDGGSTLTIVNVTRYDQGPLECHVFNPVSNSTSEPVNLSISFGPENINLMVSPSEAHFEEGSNISLICSAVSRPPALFYCFLNGVLLSDTGPELRLMNIQMSQSGNYSCQAFNNKTLRYQTSEPSAFSVLKRISGASVTPSTNLTVEGTSVNLTCDAAASIFTREWRVKHESDGIRDDNFILYDNNRVLSLLSLNKTDSGEYFCKISNPVSSDEASYKLVVKYGPENVQITGQSEIYVKDNIKMICSSESVPSATYTWMLNGKVINNNSAEFFKDEVELSDRGNYTYLNSKRMKPSSNGNTSTVTGGAGQDNAAFSNQELNYADINFSQNRGGGSAQLDSQNASTDYAQVRINRSRPAASSPPSYDVHLQRVRRPAPQPDAQMYSQIRKN